MDGMERDKLIQSQKECSGSGEFNQLKKKGKCIQFGFGFVMIFDKNASLFICPKMWSASTIHIRADHREMCGHFIEVGGWRMGMGKWTHVATKLTPNVMKMMTFVGGNEWDTEFNEIYLVVQRGNKMNGWIDGLAGGQPTIWPMRRELGQKWEQETIASF